MMEEVNVKDKPVILIVDDQLQNIELLEAYLAAQGYEIVTAANGEEALRKLSGNQIDLMLLDIMMPGMDGFEVTRRVRQDDIHRLLPIILITVLRETEDRIKGIEAGCDDFISTPVDKMELLARVRSLLKVKAYNDLMSNYRKELESEVTGRTDELRQALENLQQDIAERKLAEEALRVSEEKYRTVVENAKEAIIITQDMNVVFVNRAGVDMIRYSEKILTPKPFTDFIHPDDCNMVVDHHIRRLKGEEIQSVYSFRILSQDGTVKWVELNAAVIKWKERPAILSFLKDITKRKQAEEFLKESENKYRLLADNVNDVIFVLDMNLNYTYVSPSIKILWGYEPTEVLKQQAFKTLTPSSWELAVRTLSEVIELEKSEHRDINISRTLQLETIRKDGTIVWVEVKFSFLRNENHQAVGILGVTRDITERKQADEELRQTLESLRKAVGTTIQVMVSAVEMKDPYTAGHQLRSANLACAIATEMGLPREKIDGIRMAGSIHDIGKLSIPSEILSKPTKLTNLEFLMIKEHAQIGYEMLKNVESPWPLAQIVYQHHERMDGSGYPRNLKGDEILLEARIMAVADVMEAMASHRPYRPSLGIEVALEEIEKNKVILYDEAVADACLKLFREKGYKLLA
jgi:PAS domain S-box-containing protein/putative nucleotidyltransferase with HDIG domain